MHVMAELSKELLPLSTGQLEPKTYIKSMGQGQRIDIETNINTLET